jgi:thymidylate kinase
MLGRLAGRWLRPPGLVVVLCGADGCGKSTAAEKLIERLGTTFSPLKGRHYHWKPPVFSTRRRAARGPVSDPHGQPPRNALVSLLYLKFHWLEFFIGAFTAIRPATFKGGLVLIDRFYYDFFVDPRRYRLRLPQWVVRLGYRLLPKPDLVFLLDAPPEVLQARKQEVPFEETSRQRTVYRELIQSLPGGRIIDAAQPADKVAADLQKAVLEFLAQRAGQRKEGE